MPTSKRNYQRQTTDLPVNLVLYNSTDDSLLSGPIPAFLHDITYHGAGLILPEIFFTPYHLFYNPTENEQQILCLEKDSTDEKKAKIIIPVEPTWFRLGEEENVARYFRMGVKFMTSPEDKDVIALEKMALKNFSSQETLLNKLIRIFS